MDTPRERFYRKNTPDPMAGVRDAMSRRGDFDPDPDHYADEAGVFEAQAVLEALEVEGEVLS